MCSYRWLEKLYIVELVTLNTPNTWFMHQRSCNAVQTYNVEHPLVPGEIINPAPYCAHPCQLMFAPPRPCSDI